MEECHTCQDPCHRRNTSRLLFISQQDLQPNEKNYQSFIQSLNKTDELQTKITMFYITQLIYKN